MTTHPNAFTGTRRLASGKFGAFEDGFLIQTFPSDEAAQTFTHLFLGDDDLPEYYDYDFDFEADAACDRYERSLGL